MTPLQRIDEELRRFVPEPARSRLLAMIVDLAGGPAVLRIEAPPAEAEALLTAARSHPSLAVLLPDPASAA